MGSLAITTMPEAGNEDLLQVVKARSSHQFRICVLTTQQQHTRPRFFFLKIGGENHALSPTRTQNAKTKDTVENEMCQKKAKSLVDQF